MKIETRFGMNSIVLISTLPSKESGPSRRLAEDLAVLSQQDPAFHFRYVPVHDDATMRSVLLQLRRECLRGMRPIIHFDGHGDKVAGLQIGGSRTHIAWAELIKKLRKINIATNNQLCVVLSVCEGFNLIRPVSVLKPTPFYTLIAPQHRVFTGDLEDRVIPFYRHLLSTGVFDDALSEFLPEFTYYHAEKVMVVVLARYVSAYCVGKGARIRRERLLTEVFGSGVVNNSANRSRLRRSLKSHIRPGEAVIDHFSKRFLFGRRCSVTMAMILDELSIRTDRQPSRL